MAQADVDEASELLKNLVSSSETKDDGAEDGFVVVALQIIENLHRFRDEYFESHSLLHAAKKKDDVEEEIEKSLVELQRLFETRGDRCHQAFYLTLRGRINNVRQNYSEEAFNDLSKAIKLDPELSEAWNALGECYWQKGEMEEAKNCFEGSLKHSKNKLALRNLSITLRQLIHKQSDELDQEEKIKMIFLSLEKAKEAVQLDTKDGMSWNVLGTAYLSLFFASNQSPKTLRQCLSAYAQAEKYPALRNNPDLHYNRAMAYKYMEEYKNSVLGFHMALCLEPGWKEAEENRNNILDFLRKIQEQVNTRGKIKGKKLTAFVSALKLETALGPFAGGSFSNNGNSIDLNYVPFSELKQGDNSNRVVVGRVASSVSNDCITAFAFTLIDVEKSCVAVTMYNLRAGAGVIIGDSVAIAEPFMERVSFEFDPDQVAGAGSLAAQSVNKTRVEFISLRVSSPLLVVVNGRKWGRDKESFTELRVNSQPDPTSWTK